MWKVSPVKVYSIPYLSHPLLSLILLALAKLLPKRKERSYKRRKILVRLIEGNANLLRQVLCKRTLWQLIICLRPPLFVLGWVSNFIGSM